MHRFRDCLLWPLLSLLSSVAPVVRASCGARVGQYDESVALGGQENWLLCGKRKANGHIPQLRQLHRLLVYHAQDVAVEEDVSVYVKAREKGTADTCLIRRPGLSRRTLHPGSTRTSTRRRRGIRGPPRGDAPNKGGGKVRV